MIVLALPFVITVQHKIIHAPARLEPATPQNDRPQALALDRSATGLGIVTIT